jgi:succinyl-diaminopimelate desuccinylase
MAMIIGDGIIQYERAMIADLQQLVRIQSVLSEPAPGCPFGHGSAQALKFMLDRAATFGFRTVNVDGYAGHAEIGEGDEIAGILVHLDTVPAGEGWMTDPYDAVIRDGMIYGRGVIDNKGPAVSALYALKVLQEARVPFRRRLRVIFGTAEETSQDDMKVYFTREPVPDFGFTPDVGPAIYYGEMGIHDVRIERNFDPEDPSPIIRMYAGSAPNVVPDHCRVELCKDRLRELKLWQEILSRMTHEQPDRYQMDEGEHGQTMTLTTRGKAAHGGNPQQGINAISLMLDWLKPLTEERTLLSSTRASAVYGSSSIHKMLNWIHHSIGYELDGCSLGIACRDEPTGELIVNMGMIQLDRTRGSITLNVRHPAQVEPSFVTQGLERAIATTKMQLHVESYLPPVYVPTNHPLIVKLVRAYETIMGDPPALRTTSGGTYAKWMNNNGVGFGGVWSETFPHQAGECMRIDEWMKLSRIITQAAYELCT